MERWLLAHDFTEVAPRPGGHRKFTHTPSGVVVTLPGHGPQDLTKKHVGMILRVLERAGFGREKVRRELAQ